MLKEKIKEYSNKISLTDSVLKKILLILAVAGLFSITLLPFLVYYLFFKKDTSIQVDVNANIDNIENSYVSDDKLNSAIDKGENILDKLKGNK